MVRKRKPFRTAKPSEEVEPSQVRDEYMETPSSRTYHVKAVIKKIFVGLGGKELLVIREQRDSTPLRWAPCSDLPDSQIYAVIC
jgi:hypothetical protein